MNETAEHDDDDGDYFDWCNLFLLVDIPIFETAYIGSHIELCCSLPKSSHLFWYDRRFVTWIDELENLY